MLISSLWLGLMAIPHAWLVTSRTPSESLDLVRDGLTQDQAVFRIMDSPTPPVNKTMRSGDVFRSYRIQVPSDYANDGTKKWPLILDFHGRNGDAVGQWNNSQYYLNPSGKEYFVVYPDGCFGAGNRGGPPERAWQGAPYANTSCNDLLFVSDLVTRVQQDYANIDSTRIYATGKSNGGGFVDTLACSDTGNLFAAFAMAAAALYTDTFIGPDNCGGNRPRAILEAHGTDDDTIPIRGRKDGSTPNIAQWASRWAQRNGCDPNKDSSITFPNWGMNTTYSCNGLNDIVQQYRVTGLGHCWPSLTDNTDSSGHGGSCLVQTLDFTQEVVEFFALWQKST